MDINYNEIETENVKRYLREHPGEVSVEELLQNVEVDKLRIYAILFRLCEEGFLKETQQSVWGAVRAVCLCNT